MVIPAATNGYPVTSIGDDAFVSTFLTSVTIPSSVTNIGSSAFYDRDSLTSVIIPNSVTNIGQYAFEFCRSLTNLIIGNGITSFGYEAFGSCISLKSVTIPNSVASIGYSVFDSCIGLTNVMLPSSVTSIGNGAFEFCTSLTSVTIPNSVTNIGYGAFTECTSLTSVTIPKSVTNFGYGAFFLCGSLTAAYFLGNAPSDYGNAFVHDPATVYYLSGTTSWGSTFGGVSAVLWNPQAITPGFTRGQFGFNLTGPTNVVIVVEACTNLSNPVWLAVATNTFSASGTSTFTDPSSQPSRFYRFRSP